MSEDKSLMFVFDRMPDQDGCTFIEVENSEGQSVCAGEWRNRDDGLVELVVPAPSFAAEEPVFYAQVSGVEKKEGWRGLIKAERDSTNGYTIPLYIRPDFDAQRLRADTAEAELADMQHWRDLALQFDNHRMTALGHLRAVVRCSDRDLLTNAEEFLKAPPLAAHEVVAKLAAAEQRIAELLAAFTPLIKNWDDLATGESLNVDRARAALNQKSEGESQRTIDALKDAGFLGSKL